MPYFLKPHIADCFLKEGFEFSGLFDFSFLYTENASPMQKDIQHYQDWIRQSWHAQMNFMEKNWAARTDARNILDNVRCAIVFLVPYSVGERVRDSRLNANDRPPTTSEQTDFIKSVARYARGKDYHRVLKAKGEAAITLLKNVIDVPFEARTIVDSAPFFERAHAKQSGLGFIGKNTMLIRPGIGSFFFIATVLTTLTIDQLSDEKPGPSPMDSLNCGSCRKCIDACPTQALDEYKLDANRCLSYLSIEHRDTVDKQFVSHFKDIFFGCDICQTACPYNYTTTNALKISELSKTHKQLLVLNTEKIARMNYGEYELWFGGTSLTRAKYAGLIRNALYSLYANKNFNLEAIINDRSNDPDALVKKTVEQIITLLKSTND